MSLAYGITALIALCMLAVCVAVDKKRDVWLILVFVSVAICDGGYFLLSISKSLGDALNSNRIAYLGSVFLPFFVLMMILRFCGMKRGKRLTIPLVVLGVVMLGITTSPGILPIYYSTVDIAFVDGGTKLVREYGPLHLLYYVYLLGYMLSMVGVVLYAIAKKKINSHLQNGWIGSLGTISKKRGKCLKFISKILREQSALNTRLENQNCEREPGCARSQIVQKTHIDFYVKICKYIDVVKVQLIKM